MRSTVEKFKIGTIFSLLQSRKLNMTEVFSLYCFEKQVVKYSSTIIIIIIFFVPPFLRIIPKFSNCSPEKGEKANIPLVNNASDVDISSYILWVVCDEVTRENATQRMSAQNNFRDREVLHKFDDHL